MRRHSIGSIILAAIASGIAVPALAQQWGALQTPYVPENDHSGATCSINLGEAMPNIAFNFYKDRTVFAVLADDFVGLRSLADYTLALPSGALYSTTLNTPTQSSAVAFVELPDWNAFNHLIEGFSVPGEFSLTGNGLDIEIASLPALTKALVVLQGCLKELNNG